LNIAELHERLVNGEDKVQLLWLQEGVDKSSAKWKVVYGQKFLPRVSHISRLITMKINLALIFSLRQLMN